MEFRVKGFGTPSTLFLNEFINKKTMHSSKSK
jgi:hypothetical protein